MAWLWVVLVVVVLGLTAAVAVGRGGAMARAYPDRRDVRLPAERSLGADDLSDVEFSVVLRGYRMDEVDEVIRRLVHELADRDARLARLGDLGQDGGTGRRAATSPPAVFPGPPSDARPPGHRAGGDALVGAERDGWRSAQPDLGQPGPAGQVGQVGQPGYLDDESASLLDPWAREPVDHPERRPVGPPLEPIYPPPPGEESGRHASAGEP